MSAGNRAALHRNAGCARHAVVGDVRDRTVLGQIQIQEADARGCTTYPPRAIDRHPPLGTGGKVVDIQTTCAAVFDVVEGVV